MKPAVNKLQENTSEMYQNALKVYRENDNPLAETTCIQALQMLEQTSGLVYEKALFYRLLANIYNKTGDYRKSLENSHVSAELFLTIGKMEEAVPVYSNCGVLLHYLGDHAGAYKINLQAFELAEKNGLEQEKARVLLNIASLLVEAMARVRTLSGMLPICASCKKIRDDDGYWQQIESYISCHSEAEFSHGLCSDCMKKLYPEIADELQDTVQRKALE
ncbi:MAG: hypothetical protein KAH31_07175 [Candidatus Sabulitectum sp.]|nr:hypothetical protein [Candidatus Sabulitectum sp.]